MLPAHQRLQRRPARRRRVEQRLEVQHELVAAQRLAQARDQLQPLRHAVVEFVAGRRRRGCGPGCLAWYIAMSACISSDLGIACRPPGSGSSRCCGVSVVAARRPMSIGSTTPRSMRSIDVRDAGVVGLLGEHHHELVAAEPADRVGVAHARPQALAPPLRSTSSPAPWPRLSLISLKSSRSTNTTRDLAAVALGVERSPAAGGRAAAGGWAAR